MSIQWIIEEASKKLVSKYIISEHQYESYDEGSG